MVAQDAKDIFEIPIVISGAEDVSIHFANQFVIQHQQNEFILTIGQLVPPMLFGTDEERLEQAKKVAYVPVKVVTRLALTRQRIVELIEVLQENLRNYDAAQPTG